MLFIADLIEHFEKVAFSSVPVLLAGQLIRALLLADNLAIVAHSAADLQALLDAWAAYCDSHHFQTQVLLVGKVEIVAFSFEGDPFRPQRDMSTSVANLVSPYSQMTSSFSKHFTTNRNK